MNPNTSGRIQRILTDLLYNDGVIVYYIVMRTFVYLAELGALVVVDLLFSTLYFLVDNW